MQLKRSWVMGLLILALAVGFLSAQTRESATIQGTITDDTGAPLPGVTVTLTSPAIMGTPSAVTDKDGRYRIRALLTGVYEVDAVLEGFGPGRITGVSIHVGMTATVDIVLYPAKMETEVTVVGAAPVVDVTNSSEHARHPQPRSRRHPAQCLRRRRPVR
jgi:hypothetical protein